jgi:hypothetical protein
MHRIRRQSGPKALSLLLPAVWLAGCVEYTIETTVNPDGSGVRTERMEAAEDPDVGVDPESFLEVMYAGEAYGWSHREEVDDDGDAYHVFERRTEVADLPSWSGLNDKIRISGAVRDKAGEKIGYITMGDLRFRNAVHLRRSADSDGNASFAFRETFTWEKAVDAVGELLMKDLEEALVATYPRLSPEERGQIVGFARARYWMAVEDGLFSADGNEDALLSDAAHGTAAQALNIVRMQYPGETLESVDRLLHESVAESDDRFVTFLQEELPGLNVALNSEITFRLNMPGRVTDSNAHHRDGTTLVWEFGPGDALSAPVEIYAESVVGRGPPA